MGSQQVGFAILLLLSSLFALVSTRFVQEAELTDMVTAHLLLLISLILALSVIISGFLEFTIASPIVIFTWLFLVLCLALFFTR
ncbi:MAG: hypothetical protein ACE5OY_01990 [Candidatus Bathyarchaeia archaeon]